jgi:cyclic beta-1,2-glucan synthetase
MRRRVRVQPGATARIAFWTIAASSRADVLALVDKHQDANAFDRAATLAWTQAQVQLRHLDIDAEESTLFQRLGRPRPLCQPIDAPLLRHHPPGQRRTGRTVGPGNLRRLPDRAWCGSMPSRTSPSSAKVLRAHEYWRMKGLAVDLVILNDRAHSYVQDLQIAIETLVRKSQSHPHTRADAKRGGVFVLRADLISQETRALLPAVARVVLAARLGSLSDQLDRVRKAGVQAPPQPRRSKPADAPPPASPPATDFEFFNGLGGFMEDGRAYATILNAGQVTPAPWINVIASEGFGFQVSAEGTGYTWSGNSRENQLTPWSNDPVADRPGEVLFVRDEDSGALWGPTALPIRSEAAPYIVRHGQGYSRFEHEAYGIKLDLIQFVPQGDPIKISRLRSATPRPGRDAFDHRLCRMGARSLTDRISALHRDRNRCRDGRALCPQSLEHGIRLTVAFADFAGRQKSWTGDRREFVGRNGSLGNPAALAVGAPPLSGNTGAGLDPCGVLQAPVTLAPARAPRLSFSLVKPPAQPTPSS